MPQLNASASEDLLSALESPAATAAAAPICARTTHSNIHTKNPPSRGYLPLHELTRPVHISNGHWSRHWLGSIFLQSDPSVRVVLVVRGGPCGLECEWTSLGVSVVVVFFSLYLLLPLLSIAFRPYSEDEECIVLFNLDNVCLRLHAEK